MSRGIEDKLWSMVDRGAHEELRAHLQAHPEDRSRVDGLKAAIGAVRAEAPPDRIGEFEILRVLGEGGMGVVYEARQQRPERIVALKVARVILGDRGRERFQREIQALARLDHAGVARIHSAGLTEDGLPYLVMERVRGEPIDRFARSRRLTRDARVRLLLRVCAAVSAAHRLGVIHRDLKPQNVLVTEDGEPKVLDFGLAKIRESGAASIGTLSSRGPFGTLPFMSPEQAEGRLDEVDERTDVYALGVMLYQLLVGRLPVDVEGMALLPAVRAICEREPSFPRAFGRLPRDLEIVVRTALEKDPRRRYPSVEALAADLEAYLEHRPIAARPPTVRYRLARFYRRHFAVLTLCALLAFATGFAVYAAYFRVGWVRESVGRWWARRSPFEAMRWREHRPEVMLQGRWWRLEAIEGLNTDYVMAWCRQFEGIRWRKRFSEDLLEIVNRLGVWALSDVDLTVTDVETGETRVLAAVPMTEARRDAIYRDRYRWPFRPIEAEGGGVPRVEWDAREWDLLSLCGVPAERFAPGLGATRTSPTALLYDAVVEATGNSPGDRIDFTLRDPKTLETVEVKGVAR